MRATVCKRRLSSSRLKSMQQLVSVPVSVRSGLLQLLRWWIPAESGSCQRENRHFVGIRYPNRFA
jgi:hypothetical protein